MFGSTPETVVRAFTSARARDKGVRAMARHGYVVVNVATVGGPTRAERLLSGGPLAFLVPAGTPQPEHYTVTFRRAR